MKHLPAQKHGKIEGVFEDIWCLIARPSHLTGRTRPS